jgi:hypothetical protein
VADYGIAYFVAGPATEPCSCIWWCPLHVGAAETRINYDD